MAPALKHGDVVLGQIWTVRKQSRLTGSWLVGDALLVASVDPDNSNLPWPVEVMHLRSGNSGRLDPTELHEIATLQTETQLDDQ
jgi:hypothetical protein